jgi:hypothetical protein
VKVERLIVVEQVKGPMETMGSFELSGRVAILGRSCPREVAAAAEVLEEGAAEADWALDEACRAATLEVPRCEEEGDEDKVGAAAGIREERVAEEKERVAVDAGIAFGIEIGMATGQKLHTWRP